MTTTETLAPHAGQVPYLQDSSIWPAVESMAACLCSELDASDLPPTCFCGIMPGSIALDYVDADSGLGMAWVRVVAVYPSTQFPQQETRARSSCAAGLAAELEIGVARCAPQPTDQGLTPPTMEQQWEASRLQMADMAAVQRAVQCCYSDSDLVLLGRWTPLGPQGGVLGGTWQVYVSEGNEPYTPGQRMAARRAV